MRCFESLNASPVLALAVLVASSNLLVQSVPAHEIGSEMSRAASVLLDSLEDDQRNAIQFSFEDAQRKDWQFIPMDRAGLGLKAMRPDQRGLAMSLVQTALSHRGFQRTAQIMALEQVLRELEQNPTKRDPAKYHLFLFGEPGGDAPWAWRIEGHHLSISVTVVSPDQVRVAPSFFGSNPAEVREGPMKGLRVLGALEDQARRLASSLTGESKSLGRQDGDVPRDVILGPGEAGRTLEPGGVPASQLDERQTRQLKRLVRDYLDNFRPELVSDPWKKIRQQGADSLSFLWIGEIEPGKPHYFRVQGPTFVLEYDNTQNQANHAHLVWRDLENDFGRSLLEHYRQHHEPVSR